VHEYNSVKLVQAQTGEDYHPTTGVAREFQQPTQFDRVAGHDQQGNPITRPMYNTHMMDNYARNPQGVEDLYDREQNNFENEPTQETGPPDFEE
jgi:hypothetical protein